MLIVLLPMEIVSLEYANDYDSWHWLGPLTGKKYILNIVRKIFARGGGNTPKGIYNQNSQLKFRQWIGGVNAKAF